MVALIAGGLVGAINALFVLYFGIHSLIVTLGIGYFVNGIILWVSNSATIAGISMELNFLGVNSFVQNLFYGGGLVIAVSISQLIRGRRPMD